MSQPAWTDPRRVTRRLLVTPEGVNLETDIADVGTRISAFALDLFFIVVTIFVAFWVAATLSVGMSDAAQEIIFSLLILFLFFMQFFYFVVFEAGRRGATWGKRLMKIRVAARTSPRLTASAVFVRNALRQLEFFVPLSLAFGLDEAGVDGWINMFAFLWAAIFLFFPLFNRDRLRAGDLLAGTWVVKAPRPVLLADLSDVKVAGDFAFSPTQVDTYGVRELHVLENVLRENDPDILEDVALRIREKIGWVGSENETDRAFLDAYYRALRERLESRLVFGRRRRDKFDTD